MRTECMFVNEQQSGNGEFNEIEEEDDDNHKPEPQRQLHP